MAGDGVFEVDFAVVVFLDDAAGQRKAEAPAALFGREARLEEQFLVRGGDAFACVAQVYVYVFTFGGEDGGEGSFAFHCVYGVLADILYHPFKQVAVDGCHNGAVG